MKHTILLVIVVSVLGLYQVSLAETQSSLSQYGMTWTFDQAYEVGQFATGDWWVVGPVTLTAITPASTTIDGVTINGSMLGPETVPGWGDQALDSRMENLTWRPDLNIAQQLPYTVPVNKSVISSISYPDLRPRRQCDHQAVLTVLASPPPVGSFRPSYFGADKSIIHNVNEIDYTKLRSLPPVPLTPALAGAEEMFTRPIIMLGASYCGVGYSTAYYNCPIQNSNYGREITLATSYAALSLNLNYSNAEKELLAIRFIQYGLDIYGGVQNGLVFDANGGHTNGRKIPVLMAGVLLNDADIIECCDGDAHVETWSEDQSHFYVTQADIDMPRVPIQGRPTDPYPQSSLGMPEWGIMHYYSPQNSGYNWGTYYRHVACPNLTGTALACRIMGIEHLWNDPAFFDYYSTRWVPIERDMGTIDRFMLNMWDYVESQSMPGDANGDGFVNLDDFIILKQNYGQSWAPRSRGDFNGDGDVNLDDFIILKQNYGHVSGQ